MPKDELAGALVASACVVQGSFIVGILAAGIFGRGDYTAGLFSRKVGPARALGKGAIYYLASLPVLVFSGIILLMAVKFWNALGVPYIPQEQEIIAILSDSENPFELFLIGFFAIGIAPVVEETFFRGTLYRFLKSKFSPTAALVAANAAFAAIHFQFDQFLPLCAAGMCFTWAYERTGSLSVPIVCHMCLNANTFLTMVLLGGDLPL